MITKDMLIYDVLKKKSGSETVFFKFGMHCLGCPASRGESIEDAAKAHGVDVDALIKELNEFKAE